MSAQPLPLAEQPKRPRERRAISIQGHAQRADGSVVGLRLIDLSYEGCGVETAVPLVSGELLRLSVLRRSGITARVRWCSEGRAGLKFESAQANDPPRRQSERILLSAEATLRRTARPAYRVPVQDISPSGCRLEAVDRPELGERVWVKFDGLEALEATVCWIAGFRVGLRYTMAMHPAVFDLFVRRVGGATISPHAT